MYDAQPFHVRRPRIRPGTAELLRPDQGFRFALTADSGVPIYRQLVDQVKRAVAVGAIPAHSRLPTLKELALSLRVNVNTVARAYRELGRLEVIETRVGRGTYIRDTDVGTDSGEHARSIAQKFLSEAVRDAQSLGLSDGEIRSLMDEALR